MSTIFIPIGIDCGVAEALRNMGLRKFSLPFDWTVTYNGCCEIIKNKFIGHIPKENNIKTLGPEGPTSLFNSLTSTYFRHNKFPQDYDKMNRRIARFLELLNNTSDELVFFRKGHLKEHHAESSIFHCKPKNDLKDCEELYIHLKESYPNLKFRIIVFLACDECFNNANNCVSKTVEIYNDAELKKYSSNFQKAAQHILINK